MTMVMPVVRPKVPHFSSGPCAKRPGWSLQALNDAVLGRSHRAKTGKAQLKRAIDLTREVLEVPADYRIGIVPASDTGAVEMALWSLLGAAPGRRAGLGMLRRRLGHRCRQAAEAQGRAVLKRRLRRIAGPYQGRSGKRHRLHLERHDLGRARAERRLDRRRSRRPDHLRRDLGRLRAAARWDKLDVVTFSWQKVLGGEAAHGMLILSPRAVARLESYTPPWPLPKIFRMTKGGKLIEGIFDGETINTPSMLCVEDSLDALEWAKSIGGLSALRAPRRRQSRVHRGLGRAHAVDRLSGARSGVAFHTSVCLKVVDPAISRLAADAQAAFVKSMAAAARKRRRRLRHRRLSRRAAGPAHLVRRHRRAADVEALTHGSTGPTPAKVALAKAA